MPKSKLKKYFNIAFPGSYGVTLLAEMNNMFSNSHFAIMFIEIEKCGMKL